MALSWSERRKYTYSGVVIVLLLILAYALYSSLFSAAPTCFDGRENGDEQGVDCGGSCSLLCEQQSKQPTIAWSRSFLVGSSTTNGPANVYTSAAYVQNPNVGSGAHNVAYSFQLFDADNHLIVERSGVADIPPVPVVPIIVPNINTGSRVVARTLITFAGLPAWNLITAGSIPRIELSNQQLTSDGSRLSLTLNNNTTTDAKNITVVGVLFDADGAALAASKSLVPVLAHKSTQDVVLTWQGGVPGVVRAEVTVLPSF
ncbi:MAG TPA: hypothetical protein VG984_00745 [Candidatus Paceibacterota bacterium]|nr:hypothetical protein [Candidatus Paceibacterota bacterium]